MVPMRCPSCGSDETKVVDSRSVEDGAVIRRRRACGSCPNRFTTFERVEVAPGQLAVVPRGVEHRTLAEVPTSVLLFEPATTRNTGNVVDEEFTAPQGDRV